MEQVLHLDRADRRADLQSGELCLIDSMPHRSDTFRIQLYRNRNNAVLHCHSNGLNPQRIDAGILNAFQFNHTDTQLIQHLGQFNLLLKRQGEILAALLHGHVTDSYLIHNICSFSLKRSGRNIRVNKKP